MIGYLASYAYFKTVDMRAFKGRLGNPLIFGDSGAYTAFSIGTEVNIQNYARWLWKWHDVFDVAVNLDVIGSAEGSASNLEVLRGYGLNPLPVFHSGANTDLIKAELDRGATYIALGGLTIRQNQEAIIRWIEDVFSIVPDNVDVHGFGFTKMQYMVRWPWKSVDSSTWLSGARYNRATLWDEPNFVGCDLSNPEMRRQMVNLIADHGGNIERFLSGKFHYRDVFNIGAVGMYKASEFWASQARKKGWKEPILYLASVEKPLQHARRSIRAYQQITKPAGIAQ